MATSLEDVLWADGTEQAALIRDGQVTSAELVAAAIERCEAVNPALNAVIHESFGRASDSAARRDLGGPAADAPFAGVPMLTKDLVCKEAGQPFHEGSRFLKELEWTADEDMELATRFRRAGLISIGRTNTPEFGMRPVCEPLAYGPTNNPWDLTRTPGGSSGGSAAAVAAGIVPIAHANDVGGSIRNPASNCGLFGLKPSRGRSCMAPDFGDAMGGLAEELVVTRSVRDTAAVLDAVVKSRYDDWYLTPPALSGTFAAALDQDPRPLRIGFLAEHPLGIAEPVSAAVRAMAETLASLGHRVDEAAPPALLDTDVAAMALPHYGSGTAWVVDHHWPRVVGQPIPPETIEPVTAALAEIGRSVTGGALLEARELAQAWTRRLVSWWIDDGYDLLLTPVLPDPPVLTGEADDMRLVSMVAPWNLSGLPAASVPGKRHDGLPIGVQFIAAPWREDVILGAAAQVEAAEPWVQRPNL